MQREVTHLSEEMSKHPRLQGTSRSIDRVTMKLRHCSVFVQVQKAGFRTNLQLRHFVSSSICKNSKL